MYFVCSTVTRAFNSSSAAHIMKPECYSLLIKVSLIELIGTSVTIHTERITPCHCFSM